jgi:hypothetical protein
VSAYLSGGSVQEILTVPKDNPYYPCGLKLGTIHYYHCLEGQDNLMMRVVTNAKVYKICVWIGDSCTTKYSTLYALLQVWILLPILMKTSILVIYIH